MRRFLLLTVVLTSALRASSLTSASCTVGTTTQTVTGPVSSSCFIPVISGGVQAGYVMADASASNSITQTQATMAVMTDASVSQVPPNSISSAAARAGDNLAFSTTGSDRLGFIHFDIQLGYAHEDFPGAAELLLSDGVHQFDFIGGGGVHGPIAPVLCGIESCEYVGTLPFDLGQDIQISASTLAGPICCIGGRSGDSIITFSLLEADGHTLAPFFVTPEPATWGLFLFGLVACGFILKNRSSAGTVEDGGSA